MKLELKWFRQVVVIKNTVRQKKYVYDKEHTHKLESARFTNAKFGVEKE